jgi:hypothetical protein
VRTALTPGIGDADPSPIVTRASVCVAMGENQGERPSSRLPLATTPLPLRWEKGRTTLFPLPPQWERDRRVAAG